jgi:hypothetical protein
MEDPRSARYRTIKSTELLKIRSLNDWTGLDYSTTENQTTDSNKEAVFPNHFFPPTVN